MIEQGGRGGVADYTDQLTRALAAQGWQVALATADDHRYAPSDGVLIHAVFHYVRGRGPLGRAVRRVGLGPVANALRFVLSIPRLVRLSRDADLVHAQGWEYAPLGLLAVAFLRAAGATIVQTPHNTFERDRPAGARPGALLAWTHAWLARLSAATIVHAQADLARLPRAASGRVAVIPHGEYGSLASTGGSADRDSVRKELGIPPEAPVTLLFGQLRVDKGLGDLLAALVRLPELRLLVAGQEAGALAAARAQLADPRLAARVSVREGYLEMSDAAKLFAATDTVVLPYQVASQSGVLLLAYGFRRPVVVYPVGGLVEAVIDGETGWICSRPDVDALVSTLAAACAVGWPECRRRGEAGHALAGERYAWPAIGRRTTELYRQALAGRVQLSRAG
jgi:glycosyltransferase involved in cell wall biosynthesis